MLEPIKSKRNDLLALGIVVFAISLLHLRGILPGQTFLPVDLANNLFPWRRGDFLPLQNPLVTDPLFEFYPYLVFSVDTLREAGQWPLWNPYFFLGHPVIADPNAQPFYPFYMLLGLALGAARALAIGPWLHTIMAACLVFAWVRAVGYSRKAALLAGLAYAASGHMITWFGIRQWQGTLTWLPGVLWAFELFLARRRWRYLALAALFQGLALLSGQYQILLTFSIFLVLYAILRTLEERRQRRQPGLQPVAGAALIVGLGVLLNAIQLLPTAEFLGMSHRAGDSGLLMTAMDPRQLITLIVPDFFGNPATVGDYWGQISYAERTIYAGLVVLLLAVMAPFVVRRRRFFVAGLSLLVVVLIYFIVGGPGVQLLEAAPGFRFAALGRSAGLLPLWIALLAAAAFDEVKTPARWGLPMGLLLAGLVGVALAGNWGGAQDHWQALAVPLRRAAVWLILAVLLLILRAAAPRLRRATGWALLGLVFLDLYLWGHTFNPAGPIDQLLPANEATDYLQANVGDQRVAPLMPGWDLAFGPNLLSVFEIAEPGGYSSLVPARVRELFIAGDPQGRHWNILAFEQPALRLLDLFQVGYVASPQPREDLVEWVEVQRMTCSGSTDEITADTPVSGRFTPTDSAINRFDLKFRREATAVSDAVLLVRLWQGNERERLALETQQAVADLTDGQEVTWYFAPEATAPGQVYVWEVSLANEAARTGVSLCTDEKGQPALAVYGQVWTQVFENGIYYQQRSAAMPRSYVVYAAEAVTGDQEAVERLLSPEFDLRNTALLAEPVDLPVQAARPASRATLVEYGQTRVVVEATAKQPGLLLLGDLYHPGWQVTVDGQPAELLRANHVLRGVLLPAGQHRVEFRFQPSSLRNGGLISLAALLFLLALLVLDLRQRRAERL